MILEKEFQKETGWKKVPDENFNFTIKSPNGEEYERGSLSRGAFLYYFSYSSWLEEKIENQNK